MAYEFFLTLSVRSSCIDAPPRGVPSGRFRQEVSKLISRVFNLKINPDRVIMLGESRLYSYEAVMGHLRVSLKSRATSISASLLLNAVIVDSAQGSGSLNQVHAEIAGFALTDNGHIVVRSDHDASCEQDTSELWRLPRLGVPFVDARSLTDHDRYVDEFSVQTCLHRFHCTVHGGPNHQAKYTDFEAILLIHEEIASYCPFQGILAACLLLVLRYL